MREAGVNLLADIKDMAVMGFSDLPKILPRLSRLRKKILKEAGSRCTGLVILVDYPGFNLNLARSLKRLNDPPKILYYIAPQVWAWRSGRIRLIRRVIDQMAVIFPFEEGIFRKAGVPVEFVGHPLLDELREYLDDERFSSGSEVQPLLALLPGSRIQEIKSHLPVMLEAVRRLKERFDGLQVGVGCADSIEVDLYKSIIAEQRRIELYKDSRLLLSKAAAAVVCSGTATLEAALLGVPQVVVYRTSLLNYFLAQRFVRLDNIALVNVTAGRQIVTELIQSNLTPVNLASEIEALLCDNEKQRAMKEAYRAVRQELGVGGAAGKVARMALGMITSSCDEGEM